MSEEIQEHYGSGYEAGRLDTGEGKLERARTEELLARLLPDPPATVLDVGGGPGGHALWLARRGYRVHLIDIVPLHVTLAKESSLRQPGAPLASASIGDARSLSWDAETMDAVLLLGPLYHLTKREDRRASLVEAHRVLKSGGVLLAAGISRFASALDGLRQGYLRDAAFARIVDRDLSEGQHRNPTGRREYFMDAFFHHPDELRLEVMEAAFAGVEIYGIEGPGWLAWDFDTWWEEKELRQRLLSLARTLEREPSLLGISAHILAVGKRKNA